MKYVDPKIKYDYVYIISDGTGYIKVGISANPENRKKQLQTSNPNKLEILFTEEFECNRNHLLKIERNIHRELKQIAKHMKGEWFYIEESQLREIKNIITWNRIRYDLDTLAFR